MAATVRKEISKDDYKFFIGRVEKISNGQVEFIADTQKKAIELLGEKIPQNVIDAANNYKAFNVWLGNAVNPIIISDSGYEEEIRIFGDGYDFFEVKAENAAVNVGTKFEVGKWYYNVLTSRKNPAYKVTHRTKKMVTLVDDFGEVIKRKVRVDRNIEEIYIGDTDSIDETILQADCFCTNIDEIQKAEDDLAYSLAQDAEDDVEEVEDDSDDAAAVEEINAEKNSLKAKVAEILKSKIAEQKSHPHKGIDWKATFEDMQISEIFNLQKDLKKFLKLGQIDLAENVFSMLKTLCKNYREQFAA